jgi:tetratricopeptide (TPR) repeat protein
LNPIPTGTIRRQPSAGRLLVFFGILVTLGTPSVVFSAEQIDLVLGEAYFMAGSFQEAVEHLTISVQRDGDKAHRALYLLGRISLLTGDFRQSKEFFERAQEHMPTVVRWRAQAGIGDALYGSGKYEEAIRRYRIAKNNAGGASNAASVELKIALCEMALGREEKAKSRMREAIEKISVLSSWSGKEEAFYKSLSMQGLQKKPGTAARIYVTVGPVSGIVKGLGDLGITSEISSSREKIGGKSFLRCGPFSDPVEAMIFAESVKNKTSLDTEVQVR